MSAIKMDDVVIIGGGFTGLTAAYELLKRGHSVTILESESEIGGLAAAFDVGAEKLDRFLMKTMQYAGYQILILHYIKNLGRLFLK